MICNFLVYKQLFSLQTFLVQLYFEVDTSSLYFFSNL